MTQNALLKFFFVILVLMSMTACTPKFFYNNADWLVYWYKDDYFQLDEQQDVIFDQALDDFLSWHRYQALPDYVLLLQNIQKDLKQPLTQTQLQDYQQQLQSFGEAFFAQLGVHFSPLLADLSSSQVAYLFDGLNKSNQKYFEKQVKAGAAEIRQRKQERLEETLERWLEKLTEQQSLLTEQLIHSQVLMAKFYFQNRVVWQAKMRDIMTAENSKAIKSKQLRDLFKQKPERSETFEKHFASNSLKAFQWLQGLQKNLTQQQKIALAETIADDIQTMRELSQKPEAKKPAMNSLQYADE